MTFKESYTKVQYSMDTSLIKNKREFAKQMYVEGMKRISRVVDDYITNPSGKFIDEEVEKAIAEESK